MLIAYTGNLGAGKTLSMTYMGSVIHMNYVAEREDALTAANYNLTYADRNLEGIADVDDASMFHTGQMLLDELWAWADSRSIEKNELFNEITINSRKRGWLIHYTAQKLHMVDKRVRELTDIVAYCEHDGDTQTIVFFDGAAVWSSSRDAVPLSSVTFNPSPFYSIYDTDEEIAGTGPDPDDVRDKYAARWRDGHYQYKKDMLADMLLDDDADGLTKTTLDTIASSIRANEPKGDYVEPGQRTLNDGGDA